MKDIFRSRLSLALLFCIRQFPPIKGGFITFVTSIFGNTKIFR